MKNTHFRICCNLMDYYKWKNAWLKDNKEIERNKNLIHFNMLDRYNNREK